MTLVRIESWDGDLAFKLPDDIVRHLDVKDGDKLDWEVRDGKLAIKKAAPLVPAPDRE